MRLKLKILLILISLVALAPIFLLNSKPALASVAHIVRLKYQDGSPVVGADVILHNWQYIYKDNNPWDGDCDWWSGPNWHGISDQHGIVVFKMTDETEGYTVLRCSTGWSRPSMIAVVYLNQYNGGFWRFDQLSPGKYTWPRLRIESDEVDYEYLIKDVVSDNFGWLWENIKTNARFDCDDDGCKYFNEYGFSLRNNFEVRGNIVKAYINPSDGPAPKTGNFYWEWTWIGPVAENPQKENALSFVDNFLASLKGLLRI